MGVATPNAGSKPNVSPRKQDYPFMFEAWKDGALIDGARYVLPINPETYRISHTTRATATYTLGGAFEDNIGLGLPRITIQGTFGYLGTIIGGGGMHAYGSKDLSGWDLYRELESNFLNFYSMFGTGSVNVSPNQNFPKYDPGQSGKSPVLKFYNYTDKDYFDIQINKFDLLRSTQRKFLYQYDLQLTALGRADSPYQTADAVMSIVKEIVIPDPTALQQMIAVYSGAMGTMADIQSNTASVVDVINQINAALIGFTQGTTDTIKAPFALVKSALTIIDTIQISVRNISGLPHEITNELRGIKLDMLRLTLHKDKFQAPTTATGTVSNSSAIEIMTAPIPKELSLSDSFVPMLNPETTAFAQAEAIIDESSLRQTTIKDSDTLETLAANLTGSASNWQLIAKANSLEYPFIGRKPMDKFSEPLYAGILPNEANAEDTTIYLTGIPQAAAGNILVFGEAVAAVVAITIDPAGTTTLEGPLSANLPAGTIVQVCERAVSVLLPGDEIRIPSSSGATQTQMLAADVETFAAKIYGSDEALDAAGIHAIDAQGGVATVTGFDNLAMQLQHRLNTVRGELALLGHPAYGSLVPTFIGEAGIPWVYERILMEARYTLLEDPRVSKVDNVTMQVDGTGLMIEADVYPINQLASQRLNFIVS